MIIKNKLSEAAFPNVEIYTKPKEEYLNGNFFGLIFAVLDATWLKRLKNAALVILAKMEIRRWLCGTVRITESDVNNDKNKNKNKNTVRNVYTTGKIDRNCKYQICYRKWNEMM